MELIRVTEVLSPYQDFSKVPDRFMEPALERGSKVHLWCANYARSLWCPITLEDYRGYIESFKGWFDKYVEKVFFVEQRFDDPDLGITGQPDIGCLLKGESEGILPDYKTSATTQRWWLGQNALYLHLVQKAGFLIKRAGSLKLKANGSPAKFVPCDVPQEAFKAALSAINAYRYFKKS